MSDVRNTTDEAVEEKVGDYYGQYKPIYIGPDKNIIPEDITWMANRAADRGYPVPRAFIGSKSDASFVHKVYGVTSEGEAQPRYQRERLSSSGSRQSAHGGLSRCA
ncbi:NAD-specific glutamate dehydrogenase [Phytophthora cinnamomi]|uniref:NAD-specific glutamate dehydrogenase n=1 Tax=Phytophthora cinnamomi TaxID=4785 RepID=UPI003559A35B|nr:NAD-specific glutamate dehydrogenase [Phytophthora cinnamomi]